MNHILISCLTAETRMCFGLLVTSGDLTACVGVFVPSFSSSLFAGFPHPEDAAMPQQREDPRPSRRLDLASHRLQTLKPGRSFP